jgi:periplasmic protein TonB
MMNAIVLTRLVPVTASLAIHVALIGGIALLPAWTEPRESVVLLELVDAETPPAPVAPPPRRDPRPLTLPRPIATPRPAAPPSQKPAPVEKPVEPPPPPRLETPPELPKPAIAAAPAPSPAPTPSAAVGPPPSLAGDRSAFTPTESVASNAPTAAAGPAAPAGPAIAALPSDGITQRAIPRGGYQYRPSYPSSARNRGIQGTTLLGVLVADDGRVAEVVVKESAGHPDLDKAAADAVRRWRFEPARRGSDAVAMWVLLPVEFKLR